MSQQTIPPPPSPTPPQPSAHPAAAIDQHRRVRHAQGRCEAKALQAAGRPVIGFGAASPTSRRPTTSSRPRSRPARPDEPPVHPGRRPSRAARGGRREDRCGTRASRSPPARCWSPTVASRRSTRRSQTLLDPADEVLAAGARTGRRIPRPIRLAGGMPVDVFAGEPTRATSSRSTSSRRRAPTAHQGAAVRARPRTPPARSTPGAGRGDRRVGLEHGIWVVTDEIYEHLTYGGVRAPSRCRGGARARGPAVLVNGVAKTYAMTGWRLGWMVGPADVIKAATNLQSHLSSNVNNVSQRAAIAALTGDLSGRRHARGVRPPPPRRSSRCSTIDGVACPFHRAPSTRIPLSRGCSVGRVGGLDAAHVRELADLILDQADVAAVPGEAFGPSGYLRFVRARGRRPR